MYGLVRIGRGLGPGPGYHDNSFLNKYLFVVCKVNRGTDIERGLVPMTCPIIYKHPSNCEVSTFWLVDKFKV